MGFKVVLNIRQVNGMIFSVETEADADCLGLKVLIMEAHGIPLNEQRLVYNGTEINDDTRLAKMGIRDGDTIFLVRTSQNSEPVRVVAQEPVVQPQPQRVVIVQQTVQTQAPAAAASVNNRGYQPLDIEGGEVSSESQEKMDAVFYLAKWVRAYLVFAFILCIVAFFASLGGAFIMAIISVICAIIFGYGIKGTRKINSCFIIPSAIVIAISAFINLIMAIVFFVYAGPWGLLPLLIFAIKITIFSCVLKLVCRINRLTPHEKETVASRVKSMTRCCCCTRSAPRINAV